MPRVELARSTGLSFPAISAITSKLIAEELLCEAETEAGAAAWPDDSGEEDADGANGRRRGRPAVLLTLNPEFGRIIAVSLRMNLIETLIADFSGAGIAQSRLELATRALDADAVCNLVIAQIDAILEATATPRDRLLGIGIALQGIVNDHRHRSGEADPAGIRRRGLDGERCRRGCASACSSRTGTGGGSRGHDHGRPRRRHGRRCRW
jgi:hypothetical protein